MKPALVNSARWFSQLGSLISTVALGLSFLRKSAPTFKPPVPPMAWMVATRPEVTGSLSGPKTRPLTALS
ncbi:hypothetical protein D3C72_1544700 [compost metagenome]